MLYYDGHNVTIPVILVLACAVFILFIRIFNPAILYPVEREKIIGYSIDEMVRASDSSVYYDTTAIICKKGDSIFIRGTSSYTFKRKDSVPCQAFQKGSSTTRKLKK